MATKVNFFWFRRDLRLFDNKGLFHALNSKEPTIGIFIFDTNILKKLSNRFDARVSFLHDTLTSLQEKIKNHGGNLLVEHGDPVAVWEKLTERFKISSVHTNRDYEPYALERDEKVREILESKGVAFSTYKDHVIFEGTEIAKDDGLPYTVFTPYSRKWKAAIGSFEDSDHLKSWPSEAHLSGFYQLSIDQSVPALQDLGFERSDIHIPPPETTVGVIRNYKDTRNFPGKEGTSRLGIHFRFGTISIREKVRHAAKLSETYVNELIWRDFYSMILQNFPHVVDNAFRPKYDQIEWVNDENHFKAWCEGRTGYPMVDAGMRELNQTGYMHNRSRMITASFLTKHLLTDWRWGEAYFAEKLLDFDLASNNGGWQWAAGSGTDAAPYFRIFNPTSQQTKFDKDLVYIKQYIPEYGTDTYPAPIIDHKEARARCLKVYRSALN